MTQTPVVPVLPSVYCWAQQIDSLCHKNQDHPTWILWQALCFYTAPVGQTLKVFQILGINSYERREKADFSSFEVMPHTAFHSVFKPCICLIPTPSAIFSIPSVPWMGLERAILESMLLSFVNITKKLLTPTVSLLESHQYRSSGSPRLLTLAWGQEASLVLIRGDRSDNLDCLMLSVHPVSSVNRQITFDCSQLLHCTTLYGSSNE